MVFHDHDLDRLTEEKGGMRLRKAEVLRRIHVAGTQDHIPMLVELLEAVRGDVGLVLELKGNAGEDAGFVEAVARVIEGYEGPLALMSFNHWLVEDMREMVPARPRGLTAEGSDKLYETHAEFATRAGVDFVSYGINDLPCRFVDEFRAAGRPAISWTIRTPELAAKSALHADQITFEGFDPRTI
jgi:glycerophosphoryl diester phosphodiesterase